MGRNTQYLERHHICDLSVVSVETDHVPYGDTGSNAYGIVTRAVGSNGA